MEDIVTLKVQNCLDAKRLIYINFSKNKKFYKINIFYNKIDNFGFRQFLILRPATHVFFVEK